MANMSDPNLGAARTRPAEPTTPERLDEPVHIHVHDGGEVTIDLTDGEPRTTTDMQCPNCMGQLVVDNVDPGMQAAAMWCRDCHFQFVQRLTLRSANPSPTPKKEPGFIGRFFGRS